MVEQIRVKGILRKSDPASPPDYGSHYIEQDGFFYALSGDDVALDDYERMPVWLHGKTVEGSAEKENGPQRLQVTEISLLYY